MRLATILSLCVLLLLACSGERREAEKTESFDSLEMLLEGMENNIKYKVNLLCLKYGISSDGVREELVSYFKKQSAFFQLMQSTREEREDTEKEILRRYIDKTDKLAAVEELNLISTKHNVSAKVLASLAYDYEMWSILKGIEESLPVS